MTEIRNAIVKSVSLSTDDHGCLSAWLQLDYGGSGQGFGGWNLYAPKAPLMAGRNFAGFWIWRVLETVGATEWSKLVGKTLRVRGEPFGRIDAIGHVIEDKWFEPRSELQAFEAGYDDPARTKVNA